MGGDIILEVLGLSLADPEAYLRVRERVAKMKTGDKLTIKILRGGDIRVLTTRVQRID